jgi:hypothetical protein
MTTSRVSLSLGVLWGVLVPLVGAAPAAGQIVRDLVVTGGLAGESYSGNLSAVTLPVVDSINDAAAAVGQFSTRLELELLPGRERSLLDITIDAGLRQFAATGFKVRDYAPREWVGSVDANYSRALQGWGSMILTAGFRGRKVEDRPPMPLFLQPGYNQWTGGGTVRYQVGGGLSLDLGVSGQIENYEAIDPVPQLDLLDRRGTAAEVGLNWLTGHNWRLRFFAEYERSRYPQQGSFVPDDPDPFRRDETGRLGGTWTYLGDALLIDVGLEGTRNRSSSRRPEYDAVAFRAQVTYPLPWSIIADAVVVVTDKSYLFETEFVRLVPGEEADNASQAYLTLSRPLAINLDAALQLGWTRAETDVGEQYYERYGMTVLFRYRPNGG